MLKTTAPFLHQASLTRRASTLGACLSSSVSSSLQRPRSGRERQWTQPPQALCSAALLAHPFQRRCWRLYEVPTGRVGTWWWACPTPAASGAAARVKLALSAETLDLHQVLFFYYITISICPTDSMYLNLIRCLLSLPLISCVMTQSSGNVTSVCVHNRPTELFISINI